MYGSVFVILAVLLIWNAVLSAIVFALWTRFIRWEDRINGFFKHNSVRIKANLGKKSAYDLMPEQKRWWQGT